MIVAEQTVEIINQRGLHARAAAKFVQVAEGFGDAASVTVAKDDMSVGGTSIMGILMLAAGQGSRIGIRATGPRAVEAVEALVMLVKTRFGEDA